MRAQDAADLLNPSGPSDVCAILPAALLDGVIISTGGPPGLAPDAAVIRLATRLSSVDVRTAAIETSGRRVQHQAQAFTVVVEANGPYTSRDSAISEPATAARHAVAAAPPPSCPSSPTRSRAARLQGCAPIRPRPVGQDAHWGRPYSSVRRTNGGQTIKGPALTIECKAHALGFLSSGARI